MPNSLETQVRKTIHAFNMLSGGEHVLVAVSGGADSTALLLCLNHLASEFRLTLTVAHLNHGIRGTEADADEDFVRRMSAELKLPFITETVDILRQSSSARRNLEDMARQKRYEFLGRCAREIGAQKIAVGHTLNDQAETVLFRFLRGSGIQGLAAIHPVIDRVVIRPLLECSRKSVLQYLGKKRRSYCQDSTNADLRHARNRIRQELLPYLEAHFNPRMIRTLAQEANLAREAWDFIESEARELFRLFCTRTANGISLKIEDFVRIHPALQKEVCRQALLELLGSLRGITSRHIDSLLLLAAKEQSGSEVQLPRGACAIRQFGWMLIQKEKPNPDLSFSYELGIPGRCVVSEAGAVFTAEICNTPDLKTIRETFSRQAFFEASALPQVLRVRSRVPGDRYGGSGHRKVKKMMINGQIPIAKRSILPVLAAGNDVIWIPGFRPARAYEVRPGSLSCVAITWSVGALERST